MTISNEAVREAYQAADDGLDFKRRFQERGHEFDQWLETIKTEARAEALEEAAKIWHHESTVAHTLRARAVAERGRQ